jgi:hypothetical protein
MIDPRLNPTWISIPIRRKELLVVPRQVTAVHVAFVKTLQFRELAHDSTN